MRLRASIADLLLRLPRQDNPQDREATFRQVVSSLARVSETMGPPPLDGTEPGYLEVASKVALDSGLLDRLDFLSPGSAALALYELSTAVPVGQVRRELRKRMFSLLYEGDASTFLPVATRMALGNASPLSTPTLRARVALCLELPVGSGINCAPLALALSTRSETHEIWVGRPSTQALPSRRLAALLFEHAAREAVFRFQLGDPQPRNLITEPEFWVSFRRLLADREPLVWVHAAVARGLLAAISPTIREEVEQSLDPQLGITEWRRGIVSLTASTLLGDEEAMSGLLSVLRSPLAERDPGLLSTCAWGLPRVIEHEPEAAERVLDFLASRRRPDIALSVGEMLLSIKPGWFEPPALAILREQLREAEKQKSALERVVSARALRRLSVGQGSLETELSMKLGAAFAAYESGGARQAWQLAKVALHEAHEQASFAESGDTQDESSWGLSLGALLDMDSAVFERPLLAHLLLLGKKPGESDSNTDGLDRLFERVTRWVLDGVEKSGQSLWTPDGTLADQRRLRVLLHLLDSEFLGDTEVLPQAIGRLLRAVDVLLERIANGPDAGVHRVLCAALARCFDSMARSGLAEPGDIVLTVAAALADPYSVLTIAEASTSSRVAGPIGAFAHFMSADDLESKLSSVAHDELEPPKSSRKAEALRHVGKVLKLSQGLFGGGGYQAEALRRIFFRLGRALEAVVLARGQTELVEARESAAAPLEELHQAVEQYATMSRNAELRLLGLPRSRLSGNYDDLNLPELLAHGIAEGRPVAADDIARAIEGLVQPLPPCLAQVVEQIVFPIHELPLDGGSGQPLALPGKRRAPLPDWLLPRRVIGSFFVLRSLGAGGVSSVFVARRVEERNSPKAETFALKVPQYDPNTARSMSEAEFFQLFREEAGALLALPVHENLARFVTFDLAARPRPILVMELIRGTGLDRLLRAKSLSMRRVITYLDDILAGLEAMHAAGLGHLDLKPSNVILRDGKTPVLVDFGLSGRKLRPGCGTIEYTAPEVLGLCPPGHEPAPPPVDIYAFGALAFELLTGEPLFDGPDELSLVSRHLSHDGWVEGLQVLDRLASYQPIARLLGQCLRRDPRLRPTAAWLRQEVTRAMLPLAEEPWPAAHFRSLRPPAGVPA